MTIRVPNEFALMVALEALAAALAIASAPVWLRLPVGLPALLFIPGYTLTCALFPSRNDLDGIERLALSVGLSIAAVPILALGLDYTPWGLRVAPIVVSLVGFVLVTGGVAWYRRQRLDPDQRPVPTIVLEPPAWHRASIGERATWIVMAATVVAVVVAMAITISTRDSYTLTEFYLLGPEGLAERYPREAKAGGTVAVTVGIANQEGVKATYRAEVRIQGQQVGGAGPITLAAGEVWEQPVSFTPSSAGKDQNVQFLLFREGYDQPYRSLRLWLDVR